MVDLYFIFDIAFIALVLYFSKIAYEKKYYVKFFEYFKIIIAIYIASNLAPYTGKFLQTLHITKADSYIILILISFALNIGILFFFWKNLIKIINRFFNTSRLHLLFAKILSFFEVLIVFSLGIFLVMQLYISKKYVYNSMKKTYTYSYIEKFYIKFLNNDILAILQGSSTGTSTKEILFKSFTN